MKKILAGALALVATSDLSRAADLASKPYVKAPSAVLAVYDWSGLYIGANAGYGTASQCWSTSETPSLGCNNASGALVGGQIGYRRQFNQWVVGAEAQGNWANLTGGHLDPVIGSFFTLNETKSGFGIFSAQLGYALNNILIYAKGGAVMSSVHYDAESLTDPLFSERTGDLTRWSGMVGGGIEYGLSKNWSAAVEYNHLFTGSRDERLVRPSSGQSDIVRIRGDADLVTARVNYHFH